MCPTGVDAAGCERLGAGMARAAGESSLPATSAVRAAAGSQPRSLFTAFEQTSFLPVLRARPCLCWTAQSDLAGGKGKSLKNNQTPWGMRVAGPGVAWVQQTQHVPSPDPSSTQRHSLGSLGRERPGQGYGGPGVGRAASPLRGPLLELASGF